MGLRFTLFVAIRHVVVRARSTVLILLGVAVGVFVMTVMQSLMFGFQRQLLDVLLAITPGILVRGRDLEPPSEGRLYRGDGGTLYYQERLRPVEKEKGIRNYRELQARALAIDGVDAAASLVQGRALIRFGTRDRSVNVIAVDARDYDRVVEFRSKVVGDAEEMTRKRDGVILGFLLAEELGIIHGGRVKLVGAEGRELDLRVVAFFQSGITVIDQTYAFINLPAGQSLLDYPGSASHVALRVDPLERAPGIARRLEYATGLESQSWQEINANFFAIMVQQNAITLSAVGMTLLVAGFGIANGLITAVLEKRRDIGILRALGLTPRQTALVFVAEAAIIGVAGALLGLAFAAIAIDVMTRTPIPGRGGLSTVRTFAMLRDPDVFIRSGLFAVAVSLAASLVPALRAARYDPVEIIRTAR